MVLLIGEAPLIDDLAVVCVDAGCQVTTYLVEDVLDAQGAQRLAEDARSAHVVIEAAIEAQDTKRQILHILDRALPPDRLILSAVLAVTATQIGAWVSQPDRVVGFAALPPLQAGSLIELAAGLKTAPANLDKARAFVQTLHLDSAIVADSVGLVLPRIVCNLINEASYALLEGVAQPKDIDVAMQLGTNYPRGPLSWADLIGLDIVLAVLRGLYEEYGDDHYRPSPLLKQYVRAGWLGRKTGRGFYEYGPG